MFSGKRNFEYERMLGRVCVSCNYEQKDQIIKKLSDLLITRSNTPAITNATIRCVFQNYCYILFQNFFQRFTTNGRFSCHSKLKIWTK